MPEDPGDWDRRAPLPPPKWFWESAWHFRRALVAAEAGDVGNAEAAIRATRSEEMQQWFDEHAQNTHHYRRQHEGRVEVPPAGGGGDDRYPRGLERQVFWQDGFHCRYCAVPVVPKAAQARLHALLGPELFPLGRRNLDRHGIRLCLTATMDHVEPFSGGGASDVDNMVTACWCCNYGKGRFNPEQLLLDDPRDHPPIHDDWDGALLSSQRGTGRETS